MAAVKVLFMLLVAITMATTASRAEELFSEPEVSNLMQLFSEGMAAAASGPARQSKFAEALRDQLNQEEFHLPSGAEFKQQLVSLTVEAAQSDVGRVSFEQALRDVARAFANQVGRFVGIVFTTALSAPSGPFILRVVRSDMMRRLRSAVSIGFSNFLYTIFLLPITIVSNVFRLLGFIFSFPARIFGIFGGRY